MLVWGSAKKRSTPSNLTPFTSAFAVISSMVSRSNEVEAVIRAGSVATEVIARVLSNPVQSTVFADPRTFVRADGRFDLDVLLGAFAAGMIARLFLGADEGDGVDHLHEVQTRLESLGFGFFIPLFFVVSGMKFDLGALGSAGTLLKVPMFLALFLLVRGLPALLARGELGRNDTMGLAFLQSAQLPLVVVITGLGVADGLMRPDNAAAMVGAGLLSVVLFPIIGLAIQSRSTPT